MVTWFRSQRENDDLNLLKIEERKQPPLTTAGFILVCSEFEFYGHITVLLFATAACPNIIHKISESLQSCKLYCNVGKSSTSNDLQTVYDEEI